MSNDALESHTRAIRRIAQAEVDRRRQGLTRAQRRQRKKELTTIAHSTRQPNAEEITENDLLGSGMVNGLAVVPYSQDAFQQAEGSESETTKVLRGFVRSGDSSRLTITSQLDVSPTPAPVQSEALVLYEQTDMIPGPSKLSTAQGTALGYSSDRNFSSQSDPVQVPAGQAMILVQPFNSTDRSLSSDCWEASSRMDVDDEDGAGEVSNAETDLIAIYECMSERSSSSRPP
ncbi:hypothetical protein AAF712_014922, partial [Marasmius tenuissimus]